MNLQGQIFEVDVKGLKLHIGYPQAKLRGHFKYIINADNNIVCVATDMVEYIRKEGRVVASKILLKDTRYLSDLKQLKSGKYLLGYSDNAFREKNKVISTDHQHVIVRGRSVFEMDSILIAITPFPVGNKEAHLDILKKDGTIVKKSNLKTYHSHYDRLTDSTFLDMSRQNGVNIVKSDGSRLFVGQKMFDKEFISSVYQSKSGILFLATFKQGIIVVPRIEFIGNESNTLLTSIRIYDDEKYVVSGRNGVIMGHSQQGSSGELIDSLDEHLDEVFILDQQWDDGTAWGKVLQLRSAAQRNVIDLGRGDHAFTTWNGIRIYPLDRKRSHFSESQLRAISDKSTLVFRSDGRYTCISADTTQKFIYASRLGQLYKFDYAGHSEKALFPGKSLSITALLFADGHLYCSDTESGILILKNDAIVRRIDHSDGLFQSNIKRIRKQGDQLFILSSEGLQIYNLRKDQFEKFGVIANILDRKVIDFDVSKSHLMLLRKKDHYAIPLPSLYEELHPSQIYVDSCTVAGKKIDFRQSQFDFDQNSVIFYVDYRDFSTKRKTKIVYKLEGFYDEWKVLKPGEHEIEFQSLPVGNYTFRVKAEFEGQHSREFVYSFRITPPFWQTWWFYTLLVIATILFIGSVAFLRLRRIRIKAKQRLELETSRSIVLNAQLKAIRAQMNPHFLFNSINSIQDLVLQKETLKSYDYLESFSRLVRMTLEHSEREFVVLREELEFLNLYLDLESLRFENEFQFALMLPEELNEISVPSLIIQPFVENAIKHGLLHKSGSKYLSVIFKKSDRNTLTCCIEDNGVGRKRATEITERRKSDHKSFSTEAIQARLKMINDQFGADFRYEVLDLSDANEEPSGTRVNITFPIISSNS